MLTFKNINKKPIVCCIVDNRHLYTSGWATEISNNITDVLIHRFNMNKYDILVDKDEDTLLKAASAGDYSHAIIIASGTSLGLSDRLFLAIDNLCEKEFFVAGHILHRDDINSYIDAYYELHHQFYIVNLNEYRELNYPIVGIPDQIIHTQIEPIQSESYLYADTKIPEWIRPGTIERTYSQKLHGWNLISTGLAHAKTILDVGPEIRNNKKYLYYEHDHVFIREVSSVYWNHYVSSNFYASWNSDSLNVDLISNKPIDQYVTVGIGVYWISNLIRLGVTPNTRVIFTDINYNCLKFMESMVNEWDGRDYHEFYRKHIPRLPNNISFDLDRYIEQTKNDWEEFLLHIDDWAQTWNTIRSLKFEYQLIDYMSDYNLDWLMPGLNTLINVSDVFTFSPPSFTQSLKYRISCENKLIYNLQKVDTEIKLLMTSRAADGFHKSTNRIKFGHVKDFDFTDINDLIKPEWHKSDWVHLGSKPLGI